MNPWQLLGNLAAWSLIGLLALLMGMIVISVILSLFKTARTKRMIQASRDRRATVFSGKRDS